MNPKNVNDLDPKLKETYERVMGTSFPTPQAPPQPQQMPQPNTQPPVITVQTPPQPVLQPVQAYSDLMENSQIFRAEDPFKQPDPPPADLIAKANMGSGVIAPQEPKKKHRLMPLFLGLAGVIFFITYAVIWAKVFNLF